MKRGKNGFMANLLEKITDKKMDRRDFLKASALGAAALAFIDSGGGLAQVAEVEAANEAANGEGEWIPAACWHNCGGRCINKALVVDGVVVRQKTDDTHPDTTEYPQQRGCLRGRSQQRQCFGVDRLKYPMKRKNWQPGGDIDRSLRGRDEWERITWDEALNYVAGEMKRIKEQYGNRSIMQTGWGHTAGHRLLANYGGFVGNWSTGSFGAYWMESYANYAIGMPRNDRLTGANDRFDLLNADTIVLHASNTAWCALGSPSHYLWQAKQAGVEFIYIGPDYNAAASMLEAKWIHVRPATDTAFLLAVAYTMLEEDDPVNHSLIDWDFLDKYTTGFDADHMPADAKINENFKDYVFGKYDGILKTPTWASEMCGASEQDIRWYARQIGKHRKVMLLHGYAPARCKGAENFPQLFMTIGAMGGHMGKSGHACGDCYHSGAGNNGTQLVKWGSDGIPTLANPLDDLVNAIEMWDAIIDGKYTRHLMGKRDLDIKLLHTDASCFFQSMPGIPRAIEAYRTKMDCIVSQTSFLRPDAEYSDIVLPVTTFWERDYAFDGNDAFALKREMIYFPSKVTEPLYEAKDDRWIVEQLANRLDIDVKGVYPISDKQAAFNRIAGSTVVEKDGKTWVPLVTIAQADIDEWAVEGSPQQGKIGIKELLEKGFYQVERYTGDNYGYIGYEDFIQDPENNPLPSVSGKFEIYCQSKADGHMNMGYNDFEIKPYPNYISGQENQEGYEEAFSDWGKKIKGEYPYQLFTPHYLRRAHTTLDNIPWLREAAPNPVFISGQNAREKGIESGDTVILWNRQGKILRTASVTETMMPGVIGLPHGSWVDMDEETGIDRGGADNVLTIANTTSGISGYNTVLVDFDKYDGEPLIPDFLKPQKMVNLD